MSKETRFTAITTPVFKEVIIAIHATENTLPRTREQIDLCRRYYGFTRRDLNKVRAMLDDAKEDLLYSYTEYERRERAIEDRDRAIEYLEDAYDYLSHFEDQDGNLAFEDHALSFLEAAVEMLKTGKID